MSARTSRILVGIGFAACAVMIALVAVAVAHPELFARSNSAPKEAETAVVVAERPPETLIDAPVEPTDEAPPPTPTPGSLKTRYPYLFASETPEPKQKRNRVRQEIEDSPVDAAFTIIVENPNVPLDRRKCARTQQAGPCPPAEKPRMPLPVSRSVSLPTTNTASLPTTDTSVMTHTEVTVISPTANVPFPVDNGTASDGSDDGKSCD
ncbi:MAG: hypothetical protein IT350_17895 [Deltaproteobacteria bacterium]|nr:hypothetical protein [Deltaproteobacteria bacterium]